MSQAKEQQKHKSLKVSVTAKGGESSTHNKLGIALDSLVTHIPKEWFKQICGSRVMSNCRGRRIIKWTSGLCESINVKQMFRKEFEDWRDFAMRWTMNLKEAKWKCLKRRKQLKSGVEMGTCRPLCESKWHRYGMILESINFLASYTRIKGLMRFVLVDSKLWLLQGKGYGWETGMASDPYNGVENDWGIDCFSEWDPFRG